jgi:hypothetical protein
MTGIMVHVTNLTHPGVIVTTLHRKKTPIDDGQYGPRNSQYGLRDQFDAALPVVPFAPLGVTRVLRPHHETIRGVAARVAFGRATFVTGFSRWVKGQAQGLESGAFKLWVDWISACTAPTVGDVPAASAPIAAFAASASSRAASR